MKRTVTASLIVFSLVALAAASERRDADLERIQTASTVLSQIMSAPDRGIPDSIMSGAKCIAIMPSMLKASFIFGANYGKGVATCRTPTGWSAPAFFKLTGGSFGFQAGGQASDLVLIVRTDDGMQHLLQSKFKLGADASAAAGPVGRDAQAMTDLTLRAQVLTYSRSRGLFLGVSLSGGIIKQDQADTQAFYGKDWTYYSVLNGQVPSPADAEVLLKTVEKYAPTPKPAIAPSASPSAQMTPQPTPPTDPTTSTSSNTAAPVATSSMTAPTIEADSSATQASSPASSTAAASADEPMMAAPTPAAVNTQAQPAVPATDPAQIAPSASAADPASPGGR
jgi:SH3 domain-containing YSC84-like protein 1